MNANQTPAMPDFLSALGFAPDHQTVSLYHPSGWNVHASTADGSGYPAADDFAVALYGPNADCEELATLVFRSGEGVSLEDAVTRVVAQLELGARGWRTEFPRFHAPDMPPLPVQWIDISWGGDACPCFLVRPALPPGKSYGDYLWPCLVIWTAEANPKAREFGEHISRFTVCAATAIGECGDPHLETEDFAAVLAFVAAFTIA